MLTIKLLNDCIYSTLFGGTGNELRKQLGLPIEDTEEDDNLCDNMGIEALGALSEAHARCAQYLRENPGLSQLETIRPLAAICVDVAAKLERDCALKGVEVLTGNPIATRIQ